MIAPAAAPGGGRGLAQGLAEVAAPTSPAAAPGGARALPEVAAPTSPAAAPGGARVLPAAAATAAAPGRARGPPTSQQPTRQPANSQPDNQPTRQPANPTTSQPDNQPTRGVFAMPFRRRSADRTPRTMNARYPGKCAETGQPFRAGDPILWCPATRRAYCLESAAHTRWLESRPDAHDMQAEDDAARSIGLL